MLSLRTGLFTLLVPGTVLGLVPLVLVRSMGGKFDLGGIHLLGFVLLGYAAFLAIGYHLFVRCYEEPTRKRLFGEDYARYSAAVPRWLPKRSSAYNPRP